MTDLLQFDIYLFELINGQWHHELLDRIMPFWRSKYLWAPIYLFLLVFILLNFSQKAWFIIFGLLVTIGVADFTSSQIIKKSIKRVRPCKEAQLQDNLHLLVRCGSGYSFTSSHATNHFAIAGFISLIFVGHFRWLHLLIWMWAASIAYGQVYVGVHYPMDVIAGAILGGLIGRLIGKVVIRFMNGRMSVES